MKSIYPTAHHIPTTLFSLLMLTNIEAYELNITQTTKGQTTTLLREKLTKELICGESKDIRSEKLEADEMKAYALKKLNHWIKEAKFNPKTKNAFEYWSHLHCRELVPFTTFYYSTSSTYHTKIDDQERETTFTAYIRWSE